MSSLTVRAGVTLNTLLIDYINIIPVRLIIVPPEIPPFPIGNVVGIELIFGGILFFIFSDISTRF